ncbi:MAG: hypothetical protein ACREVA_00100 [Burkholderiales bacterium]
MKPHQAQLINRFIADTGTYVIRARKGDHLIDIIVRPEDRTEAARLWGDSDVHYYYRGGHAFFCSMDEWLAAV